MTIAVSHCCASSPETPRCRRSSKIAIVIPIPHRPPTTRFHGGSFAMGLIYPRPRPHGECGRTSSGIANMIAQDRFAGSLSSIGGGSFPKTCVRTPPTNTVAEPANAAMRISSHRVPSVRRRRHNPLEQLSDWYGAGKPVTIAPDHPPRFDVLDHAHSPAEHEHIGHQVRKSQAIDLPWESAPVDLRPAAPG